MRGNGYVAVPSDSRITGGKLLDAYLFARYDLQIAEAKRLGLVRKTFRFADFADPSFLNAALEELHLKDYWQPRDPATRLPAKSTVASAR